MENNDGGPAFPCDYRREQPIGTRRESGMSMRDYFAAKALQGLLSAESENWGYAGTTRPADIASEAYRLADAMLKARAQ